MCLPSFPRYRSRKEPKCSTRGKSSAFHAIEDTKWKQKIYCGGKTENKKKEDTTRDEGYTFVIKAWILRNIRAIPPAYADTSNDVALLAHVDEKFFIFYWIVDIDTFSLSVFTKSLNNSKL